VGIPQKTQAYLAMGKPILMAVKGDAAKLVLDANAGLTCEPEQPKAIADAIRAAIKMPADVRREMAERAQRFYEAELSFGVGSSRMLAVLRLAVEQHL
jgi:glycosyltransferase involved in cell wall biosynthesis